MSGTSVDGLDLAFCSFSLNKNSWNFEIIEAESVSYPAELKNNLINCSEYDAIKIIETEHDFSVFVYQTILKTIKKTGLTPQIICSHGHTVFHKPQMGYTLQIGNGELIAKLTNIEVVCDFRRGDVALGGQGAPLVPIGDRLLFNEYDACLNLGGFSNISFEDKEKNRIAFDISPVNIVLNVFARKLNLDYDDKGNIAASGQIITDLFDRLNKIPYYSQTAPKSLSVEWVKQYVNPILTDYVHYEIKDVLHTLTKHIAKTIANELNMHKNALITGGGAYNDFLIECIREQTKCKLVIPESKIVEFKEALIFALLGVLRLRGEDNVLASVTGASRDSSCGIICKP
ncbi:MAG: anhydro-N-acetylmuramic acid kinase [Bacteroidales bacterium]|nr:anhydro-N-acetylmuramic acid kinase [Bacteroidales bacterium]